MGSLIYIYIYIYIYIEREREREREKHINKIRELLEKKIKLEIIQNRKV
jgi:hypothetical protein